MWISYKKMVIIQPAMLVKPVCFLGGGFKYLLFSPQTGIFTYYIYHANQLVIYHTWMSMEVSN